MKILIANRGEISCRIARSCRAMGITSIAVFSDADANAMHVTAADESYALGGSESAISYLSIPKIIEACKKTSADAVHPGYGFLSENPAFAQALKEAGIRFIGPTAEVIELMGDKVKAKELAAKVKASLIPGISFSAKADVTKEISTFAKKNGYPLLIKAAAGGGGRGMRRINSDGEIAAATQAAMREAKAFFGSDEIFVEKLIERARHIEVQLFGDQHGNVVSLSDRDCTMQRNHQKVIEEAPAAAIPDKIREKMERDQHRHQKLEHKHASFTAEHPPKQFEDDEIERKRASIEAALARARARRESK